MNDLTCHFLLFTRFQEQVRESKASPLSPDDAEELESPTPSQVQRLPRRGAVSSEVFTEEDAASYVKKVPITTQSRKLDINR